MAYRVVRDPSAYQPAIQPWLARASKHAEKGLPEAARPAPCKAILDFQATHPDGVNIQLGAEAKKQLFMLDSKIHYLNHGAYGACLRVAAEAQQEFRRQLENEPTMFLEASVFDSLQVAREEVASLIHADSRDVVPLTNATVAVNTIVAGVLRREDTDRDLIMVTSNTYNAVKNLAFHAAAQQSMGVLEVQLPLDTLLQGDKGILAAFAEALTAHGSKVRLAILDHVASFPPVHMPIRELVGMCRKAGAKVLVDGAHAVGAVDLDVPSLGAEYYTANLHKWLCTAKGAAFLWVARAEQDHIRPLVISHGCGQGFMAEFLWQGTQDWSAWLSVPAAIAVYRSIGFDRIRRYNALRLESAAQLLKTGWCTDLVLGVKAGSACMAAVPLPPLASFPTVVAAPPDKQF
ncbi:hypothetical protein WJX73_008728 [Symbiochloris irregularis]|uniref:Aminotransferase class V domain-containing protein n=1 Tax=Symbiochloris irregularis TaxID=706552 RepID=A0AAW1PE50_9CHLO